MAHNSTLVSVFIAILIGAVFFSVGFAVTTNFLSAGGVTYTNAELETKIANFEEGVSELSNNLGTSLEEPGKTNEVAQDFSFSKGLEAVKATLGSLVLVPAGVGITATALQPLGIPALFWGILITAAIIVIVMMIAAAFWRYRFDR